MAKEKEKGGEEEQPKIWTPDQPLPDPDDEEETTRVAQASARRRFLEEQHLKTLEKAGAEKDKAGKKRKSIFG